jgi:murein DD-endopeptidase MepM/ murein hydrolase activator NlpD
MGTAVMATIDGIVSAAGFNSAKGNYIEVSAGNTKTIYGHLSKLLAKAGESVQAGQTIALSGNSGISTGPHLDYRVYQDGKAIDPLTFGGGSNSFSLSGVTEKFTEVATKHWGLIIGGLLVLGLIGGRKSRE